ncbi:MAG: LCP family protein [Clostridia bacterium]|nr:LCP family protein [Clostridia bacterium]
MAEKKFGATSEFKLKREKKKKTLRGFQKFLIIFASVICVLLLAALLVFSYYKYIHVPKPTPVDNSGSGLDVYDDSQQNLSNNKQNKYSFMMIGCDKRNWLSDVIMIATYDVKEKQVAIMQIPRDTYVTASNKLILKETSDGRSVISRENFNSENGTEMKINTALFFGGNFAETELKNLVSLSRNASDDEIKKACENSFLDIDPDTLNKYISAKGNDKSNLEYSIKMNFAIKYLASLLYSSFGVPIDFYAQVNVDGFDNIVDAVGGVDIYVQADMNYDDPVQNLHIHIKKGYQHMDGKTAEGFVRFRYGYATADIARTDAQKIFMTAFIKKVLSLEGIMNLSDLVKEISANLNTNVSFEDALYFATNALDVDMSGITMFTCPGFALYKNEVSYYGVNKSEMIDMVNTYLNKYEEPLSESAFSIFKFASGSDYDSTPRTASDIDEDQPYLGFVKYVPPEEGGEPDTENGEDGENTEDGSDNGSENVENGSGDANENGDDGSENGDSAEGPGNGAEGGENGGSSNENPEDTEVSANTSPAENADNPPSGGASDGDPIIFKNE